MAWLTLAWIGAALFTDQATIKRRYIRQRYYWLNLDRIARVIACLVVARAAKLMPRRRAARPKLDYARPGFRRRVRRAHMLRTLFGGELRRRLKHGDLAQRYARLVRALASIDTLARRMVRRLKSGATRLSPILPVRPPHERVHLLALDCSVSNLDSS